MEGGREVWERGREGRGRRRIRDRERERRERMKERERGEGGIEGYLRDISQSAGEEETDRSMDGEIKSQRGKEREKKVGWH